LPLAQIATAMPRRRLNQSEVSATSGANVADDPRKPMSSPCTSANCQRLPANPAAMKPVPRHKVPINTGTTTPKRSASLPMRMPPRPKPIMVTV
jgi:hypothetical protein